MARIYSETDLGVLVAGEWAIALGLGVEHRLDEGLKATIRIPPNPVWNHPQDMALPFPFTLEQFRSFCTWHPTFAWEAIESPFTNDDGSLDEAALGELANRGTAAAELVRRFLTGDFDTPETIPAVATSAASKEQPSAASDKTVQPVQRGTAQDAAIMHAIREAGCDPLKLPKPPQGKPGMKAAVRAALVGKNPVFPKHGTQFEKAWERLRSRREIADLA